MPMPGDQHQETAVSANPFCPPQQRISAFTAQEIATLQSRLIKQLGPEYISTRQGPGGGRLHYLAADKVINLANEVFGFNGWSTAIQNVQIDFVDEDPRSGDISLGLSVVVRVTLRDGTFHEDIGYGSIKNCKGKAAAFEKAKKEGVTDALKRALRNFGNVLGNCLYDKDYLQKVTKMKVAPTRWDADNLHRHSDFVPIKKESTTTTMVTTAPTAAADSDEQRQEKEAAAAQRLSSLKSIPRTDSIEFDDDFGAAFDEADLTHPDESGLELIPARNTDNRPTGGMQRDTSIHNSRSTNAAPLPRPQPPQTVQSVPRPQQLSRPPSVVGQAPTDRAMQTPQPASHQQPTAGAPTAASHLKHDDVKTNQSAGSTISGNMQQQHQQHQPHHSAALPLDRSDKEGDHVVPPPDHPSGFTTGRGADLLNAASASRLQGAVIPQFDPRFDSPSIRRTSGVNPHESKPVSRQQISGLSQANPETVPPKTPAMTGSTTPLRSNYVNPAADPNRRIGMPPNAAAAHAQYTRGSYKMPVPVKRPPLSDVSNIQNRTDGAGDTKKARVEPDAAPAAAPTT